MSRPAVLLIALGLGLYGLKLAGDAAAAQVAEGEGEGGRFMGLDAEAWGTFDSVNPFFAIERTYNQQDTAQAMVNSNVRAFQRAIMWAEGTAQRPDPYRVCYGYRHTIQSLADHPAITGEWRGESLASLGPSYAGKVSTAAGAYQMIRATWLDAKRALGLRDFSPESQDAACAWLIKRDGALADVEAGRFEQAVNKCRGTWASLPGANAPGQPMRKLADLRTVYVNAGGFLA